MLAPLPDPKGVGSEQQKIEVARAAVYRILENCAASGASFGLVTFTDTVRVAVPLTEVRRENLPYIESLISMLTPSGRSAIWDALALGADLLRSVNGGVRGNLVLVTDGWDNASQRYAVNHPDVPNPTPGTKGDLVAHMLPPHSELSFRVIGIGSGAERDKGVDAGRMRLLLDELTRRSRELLLPTSYSYLEVGTGAQLFAQMVNAFLDVGYEGSRPLEQLHPEELARNAASAARALKEPQQHATVNRIASLAGSGDGAAPPDASAATLAGEFEVDVLSAPGGSIPPYLRERYGPLGAVIEAYLQRDYDGAWDRLERARSILAPVTRAYWQARVLHARGRVVEAARALLEAWGEADRLPPPARARILRRLALLQARMQNDRETETLVQFLDETESRLVRAEPGLRIKLGELFHRLLELRATYQLARVGGAEDAQRGAQEHEQAVERVFALLQDARLENTSGDAGVSGALDFIEICLAEMR
jgi:hypothetical protein